MVALEGRIIYITYPTRLRVSSVRRTEETGFERLKLMVSKREMWVATPTTGQSTELGHTRRGIRRVPCQTVRTGRVREPPTTGPWKWCLHRR